MAENIKRHVTHIKSKVVEEGLPKLPTAAQLQDGEIAVNYAKGYETLSIKNESGDVVTFSSDNYYSEKKLGSGFTGANSAKTVTEALENIEIDVDQVLDDTTSASTNAVSSKAAYKAMTDNELVWTNAYVTLSGAVSSHTSTTAIHMDATEKENLDSLEDNIATISGITAADVAKWNSGADLTDYYKKSETSGKTEISTALARKSDTGHTHVIADVSGLQTALGGKANTATTLGGYGITDAKIENGTITLGSNTITPLTSYTVTSADVTTALGYTPLATAVTSVTTSSTNGNISVNGSDVEVHGLGNAAYLNTGTTAGTVAAGNHTHSAYVNQNAFSRVTIGNTNIDADTTTDALTLSAGTFIGITGSSANDRVSFNVNTGTSNTTVARGDHNHDGVYQPVGSYLTGVTLASGTNNGTLKLTVNGSATDNIAVKGLGGAAYLNTGTTANTVAAGNHTHDLSIASTSTTASVTLAYDTSYKLTAGGSTYTFKMPASADTNTRRIFYGTCGTGAGTAAKVVSLSDTDAWELSSGTVIGVKFTYTNSYTSTTDITLNVNSSGGKKIYYNGAANPTKPNPTAYGTANRVTYYMYNGTYWVWMGQDGPQLPNTYSATTYTASSITSSEPIVYALVYKNNTTALNNQVCPVSNLADGQQCNVIYQSTGTSSYAVSISTSSGYKTPDNQGLTFTVPANGYSEVNYINIKGVIFARGV